MLAGEGVKWSNSYLGFDGFNLKSKSKSKPKESAEDKAKKKQALKDKGTKLIAGLKTQLEKAGGVKGLVDTANHVKKFVKDESPTTPDFDVNAGNQQVQDEKKEGIPVLVWVIGGVVVLVTGVFIFVHRSGGQRPRAINNAQPINSNASPSI
jgi:hypothetical protein